ncbi:MAG: hypothetical protein AB7D57_01580 [Desulfovibrionaceae bacterium]
MSVRQTAHRPAVYNHLPADRYEFLELSDAAGPYALAALAEHPDALELHLEMLRWGPRAARGLETDLAWLKDRARRTGKHRILGIRQETDGAPDPRWPKFTRHYGFTGQCVLQMASLELDDAAAEASPR